MSYYQLFVSWVAETPQPFAPEFGDFDREVVEDEMHDEYSGNPDVHQAIIIALPDADQTYVNRAAALINRLIDGGHVTVHSPWSGDFPELLELEERFLGTLSDAEKIEELAKVKAEEPMPTAGNDILSPEEIASAEDAVRKMVSPTAGDVLPPRQYKVMRMRPNDLPDIEHTYQGFNRAFTPAKDVYHVALVLVEGELDVYVLDSPDAISTLKRYLTFDEFPHQLIGVFTRNEV